MTLRWVAESYTSFHWVAIAWFIFCKSGNFMALVLSSWYKRDLCIYGRATFAIASNHSKILVLAFFTQAQCQSIKSNIMQNNIVEALKALLCKQEFLSNNSLIRYFIICDWPKFSQRNQTNLWCVPLFKEFRKLQYQ